MKPLHVETKKVVSMSNGSHTVCIKTNVCPVTDDREVRVYYYKDKIVLERVGNE